MYLLYDFKQDVKNVSNSKFRRLHKIKNQRHLYYYLCQIIYLLFNIMLLVSFYIDLYIYLKSEALF